MSKAAVCLGCRFAVWKKTKSGGLHPSGDGRCSWQMPPLAAAFYFQGYTVNHETTKPSGGYINRKHNAITTECPVREPA